MENKFYKITNEEELNKVQNMLIAEGYVTPCGQKITMADFKHAYPRNKNYLIHAKYNSITKKLEYTGGTIQVYKTYPYIGKIKFEN